jgi:hypothetical protein
MMPLAATVRPIAATLAPWRFDRFAAPFRTRGGAGGAYAVERSTTRYVELNANQP